MEKIRIGELKLPLELITDTVKGGNWQGKSPLLRVDESGIMVQARQHCKMDFTWNQIADCKDAWSRDNKEERWVFLILNDHYDGAENKYDLPYNTIAIPMDEMADPAADAKVLADFLVAQIQKFGKWDKRVSQVEFELPEKKSLFGKIFGKKRSDKSESGPIE